MLGVFGVELLLDPGVERVKRELFREREELGDENPVLLPPELNKVGNSLQITNELMVTLCIRDLTYRCCCGTLRADGFNREGCGG